MLAPFLMFPDGDIQKQREFEAEMVYANQEQLLGAVKYECRCINTCKHDLIYLK
jgi:hypothetical protein